MLGSSETGLSENTKGERVVKDHTVLVVVGKFNDLVEGADITDILVDTLNNDKATVELLRVADEVLLLHILKNLLEVIHIVVLEVENVAAGQVDALLNAKVDGFVTDDKVTCLGESRNHTRESGDTIRVQDGVTDSVHFGDGLLELEVNISSSIETTGTTRTDSIFLNGLFADALDAFTAGNSEEVLGGEVEALTAIYNSNSVDSSVVEGVYRVKV